MLAGHATDGVCAHAHATLEVLGSCWELNRGYSARNHAQLVPPFSTVLTIFDGRHSTQLGFETTFYLTRACSPLPSQAGHVQGPRHSLVCGRARHRSRMKRMAALAWRAGAVISEPNGPSARNSTTL